MPERPRDSVKATLSKVAAAEYMTRNRNCPRMAAGSVQDMMATDRIALALWRGKEVLTTFASLVNRVANTEDLSVKDTPGGAPL